MSYGKDHFSPNRQNAKGEGSREKRKSELWDVGRPTL